MINRLTITGLLASFLYTGYLTFFGDGSREVPAASPLIFLPIALQCSAVFAKRFWQVEWCDGRPMVTPKEVRWLSQFTVFNFVRAANLRAEGARLAGEARTGWPMRIKKNGRMTHVLAGAIRGGSLIILSVVSLLMCLVPIKRRNISEAVTLRDVIGSTDIFYFIFVISVQCTLFLSVVMSIYWLFAFVLSRIKGG